MHLSCNLLRRDILLPLFLLASLPACAGPVFPSRAPAPSPFPTQWQGTAEYELPRIKWTPDMVVTHQMFCFSAQGYERSTMTRAVVAQHGNGLTEVRLDVDERELGRAFFNADGRLVHTHLTDPEAAELGGDMAFELLADVLYAPLKRDHPQAVAMPLRKLLRQSGQPALPAPVADSVLRMHLEYLGHAAFAGTTAAGYRMSGRIDIPMDAPFTLAIETMALYDAAVGTDLLSHTTMTVGYRHQTMTMSCHEMLDRKASRGI
jgi:hypothetical protein